MFYVTGESNEEESKEENKEECLEYLYINFTLYIVFNM